KTHDHAAIRAVFGKEEIAQLAEELSTVQRPAPLAKARDVIGLRSIYLLKVTQKLVKMPIGRIWQFQRGVGGFQSVLVNLTPEMRSRRSQKRHKREEREKVCRT